MDLRQSTASQIISLGQFLDSTDGDTEENGLTIANTDIKLRKNGATTLANKNSGGATNISNGVYHSTLNATDTDTLGRLEIYVHVAGALAVKSVFRVLTASAFDAIYTGTFNNLGGVAQSEDNDTKISLIPTTAMRGTDGANTVVPDAAGTAPTLTEMVDGVWDELQSGHTIAGTFGKFLDVEVSSVSGGGGLTQQNVRDAMKLTPTAGAPSSDSVDEHLDTIDAATQATAIRSALGLASANMDVQFAASVTATGFNVGKTGYTLIQSFPSNFASTVISVTGDVNSDVNKINSATVLGNGTPGNLWRGS